MTLGKWRRRRNTTAEHDFIFSRRFAGARGWLWPFIILIFFCFVLFSWKKIWETNVRLLPLDSDPTDLKSEGGSLSHGVYFSRSLEKESGRWTKGKKLSFSLPLPPRYPVSGENKCDSFESGGSGDNAARLHRHRWWWSDTLEFRNWGLDHHRLLPL